ncbi:UPF0182 family protein [Tessaracoccus massiliensis]|uniref:UPF0182 family membrane protein n=1 Tax=Tessaracoccus massiliensis TaxID=1522311 RepID=UPI00058FDB07|nr:UPF0182 family protein [Tessaracoccus massiliensis]
MSTETLADVPTEPRRGPLLWTVLIIGVLIFLAVIGSRLATDYLWFRSLDFETVFTTQLAARFGLMLLFGLLLFAAVFFSMLIAYRLRPKVRRANLDSEFLVQMRDALDRRSKVLMAVPAAVLGVLGGLTAAGMTPVFLAWWHRTDFGTTDPYFGLDASFFVFTLPWLQFVTGFLLFALIAGGIAAAAVHFMTGSMNTAAIRGRGNSPASVGAQRQLSIMLGLVLLMIAVNTLLDRYGLSVTESTLFTGIGYTDASTRMPVGIIMAAIAAISAIACFVNAWKVRWSVPGASVALLVVSGLLLSMAYPWAIQTFEVDPSPQEKEAPYIANNIAATRHAYGIDEVEIEDYEATTSANAGQLRQDAEALPAIRLIDPMVVPPTFEQLQQVRGYYSFPRTLDVDRYVIDGKPTDSVVAVRELNLESIEGGDTWNNRRTVYTHGYGMVAAYGNQREANGEPVFFSGGIPTMGELDAHEPRIYFGERTDYYVVVGAPEGTEPVELDTPSGGEGRSESLYTYTGSGGVPIGNWFTKAAFAIRFGDINLMLSDRVNEESRVLHDRLPVQRVQEAAPWLTIDSDPFPSMVDGRIVWIIDGYTTTDSYPNSTRLDWTQAISDSRTAADRLLLGQQVNYVRNSVKATVDAYDGTVKLYQWDEEDPILETWDKVFPGVITPKDEISPDLLAHLRYPQDLFKAQREILGRYHTTNPGTWYQQSDVWQVPTDPIRGTEARQKQPPYFLTIRWPGDETPVYSNTAVFVPKDRENLSVYLAVNADATTDNYGRMRVLKLSDEEQIAGPGQTFNFISTNPVVAERLLPFNRQGASATAIYGNLLTLPLGGGLLYVQPIYTQAVTSGSYPALRFIVVRFGEQIGIGDTLQAALDQVFQGDAGAETGEGGADGVPPATDPDGETPDPGAVEPTEPGTDPTTHPGSVPALGGEARARQLLDEAQDLYESADVSLKEGNLGEYQAKVSSAEEKVAEAIKALDEG